MEQPLLSVQQSPAAPAAEWCKSQGQREYKWSVPLVCAWPLTGRGLGETDAGTATLHKGVLRLFRWRNFHILDALEQREGLVILLLLLPRGGVLGNGFGGGICHHPG